MIMIDGNTYIVRHMRKGTFTGRLIYHDEDWARFEIVAGRTKAMLAYNEAGVGEEVTVRRSLCRFDEVATTEGGEL